MPIRTPSGEVVGALSEYLGGELPGHWLIEEQNHDGGRSRVLKITTTPLRLNVAQRLEVYRIGRETLDKEERRFPEEQRIQIGYIFVPN